MRVGQLWIKVLFEPRDIWVGVYVKKPWWEMGSRRYAVYVCILPFLPVYIEWHNEKWQPKGGDD